MSERRIDLFDTTLRDGAQMEGLTLTADDKLRIAQKLDELGLHYIEGGWPGSNPKDEEFFRRASQELRLKHARLVTFSSTRRPDTTPGKDPNLKITVGSGTPVVCIVGKSWDLHVTEALRTTLDENLAMVADSIAYLKDHFDEVFFDAEHFFDGYKRNPEYAVRVLEAAASNDADCLVLCDTNGGCLPHEVRQIVGDVRGALSGAALGIHCHNDTDCAVANSLAALEAGAVHVQGAMNGYGERCGNANIASIAANLVLKMGHDLLTREQVASLSEVAHYVAEVSNLTPDPQQPYVGSSAFAHKAGLHASAVARRRDLYEHIDPDLVGNIRHLVVSELAGRSTIVAKAAELGVEIEQESLSGLLRHVKELEHLGYHFEAADGSFELLLRRSGGWEQELFQIESFRVIVETDGHGAISSEATVKLHARGDRIISTAEGNGPVNALDAALRKALIETYPELERIHLADYKVRILNENVGTAAVTRVLIESSDGEKEWGTIGVSENIIEASWQALIDGYVYGLLHRGSE